MSNNLGRISGVLGASAAIHGIEGGSLLLVAAGTGIAVGSLVLEFRQFAKNSAIRKANEEQLLKDLYVKSFAPGKPWAKPNTSQLSAPKPPK